MQTHAGGFSAMWKARLKFLKSFHVLPAFGDLKGCFDGRKAQNKQAEEFETKIINKFTLSG